MAQALYDEHPLDEYLKESGDKRERLPGAFTDTLDEEAEYTSMDNACVDLAIPSFLLAGTIEALRYWIFAIRNIFLSTNDDFAERFKYDLISSNLLSSSVSLSPISSHPRSTFPAHDSLPGELKASQQDASSKVDQDFKSLSSAFIVIGIAALLNQSRIAAFLALLTSVSFAKAPGIASAKQTYIPQMFEALEGLKMAGSAWDSAVNDAITIIEGEERSVYYTPSTSAPPSPSSALRITLHSTLLTTQHQCDNVRPLLVALASPVELSQLSEMYAPSCPTKPSYTLQSRPSTPRRKHASLSENNVPALSSSSPSTSAEKRQTWNGSNISPYGRYARTASVTRKKDRRRSDLSTFVDVQSTLPITPPRSPSLAQVLEADEDEDEAQNLPIGLMNERELPRDNFGTAALFLRRKRRASGADVLGLSTSRSASSLRDSTSLSTSSISPSRLTSLSSIRHPFSLSALHHTLRSAFASRRYACAHLLALRFTDDSEDESYWENVRSVAALLTSTLEDSAARLNDALVEADNLRRQEGQPTPEISREPSPVSLSSMETPVPCTSSTLWADNLTSSSHVSKPSTLLNLRLASLPNVDSFAPVPSGVTRFASHVDAISSSLSDAKSQLLECVEELRNAQTLDEQQSSSPETNQLKASEESVLQSYERLRRELGFALRECERGKAALLDVFEARRRRDFPLGEVEEGNGDIESSSSPTRSHTFSGSSKDSNDKTDLDPLTPAEGSPVIPMLSSLDDTLPERDVDDATQHLLLSASSAHLPPPGLEQIFESDSAALTAFSRERSKLPREERIRRMKTKRESMSGRGLAAHLEDINNDKEPGNHRGWGPGTDVVEELKDVIWKVGERRRKMAKDPPTPAPAFTSAISVIDPLDKSNDYETSLCTS